MTSSEASSVSPSNHKEYFTVGNRFDQANLASLLNATAQDDAEDELNTFQMTNNLGGTLGRTGSKLPNKSFNTYATHSAHNKSVISSGLGLINSRLGTNAANINATNRLSGNHGGAAGGGSGSGGSSNQTGSIRTTLKQPRNSFAFTMRTNLDQEL